jgi:ABC-type cobalamin transport system ATPase subunit
LSAAGDGQLRKMALAAVPQFDPTLSMVIIEEPESGLQECIQPQLLRDLARAPFLVVITGYQINPKLLHQHQVYWFNREPQWVRPWSPDQSPTTITQT